MNSPITAEIFTILSEIKPISIDEKSLIKQNLMFDTRDLLSLSVKIEERINVKIKSNDVPSDFSVSFLIDLIQDKINTKIMKRYSDDFTFI